MDGYIRETKVPLITTTSAATVDLKSHAVNPWVLHAFGTAPQVTYPLGDYAAKTLGFKKVAIIAEDFTYGHEGAGGFHLAFDAASREAVDQFHAAFSHLHCQKIFDRILLLEKPLRECNVRRPALGPDIVQCIGPAELERD